MLEEHRSNGNCVKRDTGLTSDQFNDLKQQLPSLRQSYSTQKGFDDALYTYLMKMRTALPNEDIAKYLGVTVATIYRRFKKVREAFEKDFISKHINFARRRDDLSSHNTEMCRILHCNNNNNIAAVICDGTYIFTHKSTNYEFQKLSYTSQKKRNFVKVMMIVGPDGMIFNALGPYPANHNDAKILQTIFETSGMFDNLRRGDVFILDRGFRDVAKFIEEKGMVVKMPNFVQKNTKGQLTTKEANESRLVTAVRFVVETRNGHMKTIWKVFEHSWGIIPLAHMMTDFTICAALINRYFPTFESNAGIAEEIANRMLENMNVPNILSQITAKQNFQNKFRTFQLFEDYSELPSLNETDLYRISLGPYQIKNAASYVQFHCKQNDGNFVVFKVPDDVCAEFCGQFENGNRSLILLMARMKSRYTSNKKHDVFVLIDCNRIGEEAVVAYCCECYNGLRTVGCCSHVMCLIWFSLYVKSNDLAHKPAAHLDHFFDITYAINSDYEDEC